MIFFDQTICLQDEASLNCKSVFSNNKGRLFEPRTRELNTLVYDFAFGYIGNQIEPKGVHIVVDDRYIEGSYRFISDRVEVPYDIPWHPCCVPEVTNECVLLGIFESWYGQYNINNGYIHSMCAYKTFSVCETFLNTGMCIVQLLFLILD